MATRVELKAGDKNLEGELALPAGEGKAGAVVVIQEWWGVDDHIRSLVDRVAAAGFVAIAPDLYHGMVTKDPDVALKTVTALDGRAAIGEIGTAVAYAREHARSNGKVAVIGFCMGGGYAFASACFIPGLAAVVPFYGAPPDASLDLAKVTAPIMAHFAQHDEYAPASRAEAIRDKLTARGAEMTLHVYDAQHAFMNDTRADVHHPENAKLAWERTIAFLTKHLA